MYKNQVMMMDATRQINSNLNFWLIFRPDPLVPPPPLISKEDENQNDEDAVDLWDQFCLKFIYLNFY